MARLPFRVQLADMSTIAEIVSSHLVGKRYPMKAFQVYSMQAFDVPASSANARKMTTFPSEHSSQRTCAGKYDRIGQNLKYAVQCVMQCTYVHTTKLRTESLKSNGEKTRLLHILKGKVAASQHPAVAACAPDRD
jgi:hypothetical protein